MKVIRTEIQKGTWFVEKLSFCQNYILKVKLHLFVNTFPWRVYIFVTTVQDLHEEKLQDILTISVTF